MRGYADCLAGFIERLGLDRPNVAGMSFGGERAEHRACVRDPGPAVEPLAATRGRRAVRRWTAEPRGPGAGAAGSAARTPPT